MIASFRCPDTRVLFETGRSRAFVGVERVATRKLALLDAAASLEFLRCPPGNRLERLSGDRLGQYSLRINDRYRICFVWRHGAAHDVEIVDYH